MPRRPAAATSLRLPDVDCITLEDGELARRILHASAGSAGVEEAELCRRFGRRVRLYGLRHLRDDAAAADLVQRVLVLTLLKLRRREVREPDRIASFVLGVARMQTREMRRRTAREVPLEAAPAPAPAEEAAAGPPPERLAECLRHLSERERSVVLLTFYQEQSAARIAEAVACTPGNVRVIRHRALGRLRDCLGLDPEGWR